MTELRRFRRAGGDALRVLIDLLPDEWDPRSGVEEVCILFADIAGYSEFVARAGDDAALAVLELLDDLVETEVSRRKGAKVVKQLGDGLMVAVKDPEEAATLALGLVMGFGQGVEDLEGAASLQLRAGVHRGPSRRRGEDYFGYHVNVAARVTDAADPGQVLVTPSALAGIDLTALGLYIRPVGGLEDSKGVLGTVPVLELANEPFPRAERRGVLTGLLSRLGRR